MARLQAALGPIALLVLLAAPAPAAPPAPARAGAAAPPSPAAPSPPAQGPAAAPPPAAAPLSPARPAAPAQAAAVRLAAEGQQLYQADRFDAALERFRQAYEAYPSPDLHVYIAASLLSLHREREALRSLIEFFADPPRGRADLLGLGRRLWQEAPEARERLRQAGAAGLPPGAGRRLERLDETAREALPGELRALLVRVPVTVTPPGAQILFDGEPLAARAGAVHVLSGPHRLRALPPPGSDYLARALDLQVRPGMGPVALALPLGLRVTVPRGRRLTVDGAQVATRPGAGLADQALVPATPGRHDLLLVSPRGRRRALAVELGGGRAREVLVPPPRLWPGLALAGVGLASLAVGAGLLAMNGRCATPGDLDSCERVYQTDRGGAVALALGLGAALGGAGWFIYEAVDHPRFQRPRLSLVPLPQGGGLVASGRF